MFSLGLRIASKRTLRALAHLHMAAGELTRDVLAPVRLDRPFRLTPTHMGGSFACK